MNLDFTTGRLVQKVDLPSGKKAHQLKNLTSQKGDPRLVKKVNTLKLSPDKNKNKSSSASPRNASFEHKTEDSEPSPHREIIKHYHELFSKKFHYRAQTTLVDGQLLKAMIADGRAADEIKAVLGFYFENADKFTETNGLFALRHILSAKVYTQTLARLAHEEEKTRSY